MRFLPLLIALFMTAMPMNAAEGPIRHIVTFKFKPEATKEEVQKIEQSFVALKGKISQIQSMEWGTDVSTEGLSKGLTHMWILSFADMQSLKTYIEHPDHVAFVTLLKPSLADVFVFDFQPKPQP
ncbi:MAG: hypothetical protein RLZZ244_418 [Verrucomicrobiota bacterium]|jgi:hypothetical protein